MKVSRNKCVAYISSSNHESLCFPTKEIYEEYLKEERAFTDKWLDKLKLIVDYNIKSLRN